MTAASPGDRVIIIEVGGRDIPVTLSHETRTTWRRSLRRQLRADYLNAARIANGATSAVTVASGIGAAFAAGGAIALAAAPNSSVLLLTIVTAAGVVIFCVGAYVAHWLGLRRTRIEAEMLRNRDLLEDLTDV